jgi:hypothetical protein
VGPSPAQIISGSAAGPKEEIESFLATFANSSVWQKANRNQCLVTQTIGIALTRRN